MKPIGRETNPGHPAMRGIFITGTDTGVGKTHVGGAIAHLLTQRGLRVRTRKPVESGCPTGPEGLIPRDASVLREAAGCVDTLEGICRHRFRAAVSPERAASREGVDLGLAPLYDACIADLADDDFLQVEGAGGFYSPLATRALNVDLAGALGLPVLLVAADRLGTINHALLTLEAIRTRGLALAGIVLNQPLPDSDDEMDNAQDIERWSGQPVVRLPYREFIGVPAWRAEAPLLAPLVESWLSQLP